MPASSPVHRAQMGKGVPSRKWKERSGRQWHPKRIGSHRQSQRRIIGIHRCADAQSRRRNVHQYIGDHAHQGADARRLGSPGLGILPYQEQDQSCNGNTAAQKPPQEAAVVRCRWRIIRSSVLRSAAFRADRRIVIDQCTTFSAISHRFSLQDTVCRVRLRAVPKPRGALHLREPSTLIVSVPAPAVKANPTDSNQKGQGRQLSLPAL